MRIFKFGGASVKDADSVKNVARVLKHEGTTNTLVVISAMGKMTNAFEEVVNAYCNNPEKLTEKINLIRLFHEEMISNLFDSNHTVHDTVNLLLGELSGFMIQNKSKDYNYIYDQIVSFGEILSTTIVSNYLQEIGIKNTWLDVRTLIKTDCEYRDAKVDWKTTEHLIENNVNTEELNITQGFLGYCDNNTTTTLGREGSDYTAGIFAYCLNAKSVTIWKDVKGVLNADPRVFNKTTLLRNISYTEAIEMAFYGASVIHPKTIQPLEQKNIPLFVRSFEDLSESGTEVSNTTGITPLVPCYIVKKEQILASISAKDFSFMVEDNISHVFKKLHEYKIKVNLIQNSAISFSVCIEDKFNLFSSFYDNLKTDFNIKFYKDVTLYTIRHFNDASLEDISKKGKPIIRQINTETAQLVVE